MVRSRSRHHCDPKHTKRHFWLMCILSVVCVFCIAILSRAELRLSGEVLGAGDSEELRRLFDLHSCSRVEMVRETDNAQLYRVDCDPYDYLVESVRDGEGGWEVEGIERLH